MIRTILGFTTILGLGLPAVLVAPSSLGAPLENPHAKLVKDVRKRISGTATVAKIPAARTETPAAGLARLKEKLAAGQREEFPAGTIARAGSHFLVLPKPMSWPDAERFAEEHGAHLAVLPTEEDRDWFRTEFAFKKPLWIGAGKSAQDRWQWIDASPWTAPAKLSGGSSLHRYLAISSKDGLFSANSAQAYGVALQWRDDGSNPALLEAQLERTAASATAEDHSKIAYPFGTRTFGDSHFFYLEKSMSWDEARKFATSLGAYLAVPSSTKEQTWICSTFAAELIPGESIWLGGFRLKPGDRWQWLSGEMWNNSGWKLAELQEAASLNRLALQKKTGSRTAEWVTSDGSGTTAKGILLEWSPPRTPAPVLESDWKPWLIEANRRIASEVESERKALRKRSQPMIKDYVRGMKRATRNGQNRLIARELERSLEAAEKAGSLPTALPAEASEDLVSLHESMSAKFSLLVGEFEQNINGHLTFYVNGIRERSKDLAAHGHLEIASKMNALIKPIQDDQFVARLLSSNPPTPLPWGKR